MHNRPIRQLLAGFSSKNQAKPSIYLAVSIWSFYHPGLPAHNTYLPLCSQLQRWWCAVPGAAWLHGCHQRPPPLLLLLVVCLQGGLLMLVLHHDQLQGHSTAQHSRGSISKDQHSTPRMNFKFELCCSVHNAVHGAGSMLGTTTLARCTTCRYDHNHRHYPPISAINSRQHPQARV